MQVLDEEPYGWVLLQEGETLYLNAFCSHSFFDYMFLMALNATERARFERDGRDYLTKLAYDVHYSAPAVKGSRSPFKTRNLTPMLGAEVIAAMARSSGGG